jgi:hypothetical protein
VIVVSRWMRLVTLEVCVDDSASVLGGGGKMEDGVLGGAFVGDDDPAPLNALTRVCNRSACASRDMG